ncbi:efflux RND transporter periplasmic adaptor subunit [Pleionea sediminis]|uniref:efflux RND transporter periplasmic adaptor subunit n=1 Tax=Pleionea sediminis TaxID=2569479 RepID=UPI0011852A19|nr:efflux RND transporter periplasmic adaptor subunit [Pleionea sediminis]
MTQSKATFIGILAIVTVAFGLIVMFKMRPEPPKKPVNPVAPLVEAILPASESHQFIVKSHGVVQPRTETTLVSEVAGLVESVSDKFFVGGYFQQGELLLKIDPTDYVVAVEQAKARLISAEAQFAQEKARAEQAQKEWDLSGRSRTKAPALALREPFLLEAKANLQSAQADLKKAEQKLARTVIRAPYNGMVKEKRADVGQFVSMGTALGVTFATDYAEVRLPLTDEDLAFINVPNFREQADNEKPRVELTAKYAGEMIAWQAVLDRMEGVVDQTSRVHYAVARINDPYGIQPEAIHSNPLKVGAFVTAHIKGIEFRNVIKIPRNAFRDLDKVIVADKDRQLQVRELEIIRAEADFVYIKDGLEQGDQVVITSIESPVQGMKLRVEGDPEPELAPDEALAKSVDSIKPRQ